MSNPKTQPDGSAVKSVRERILPRGSRGEAALNTIRHGMDIFRQEGLRTFITRFFRKLSWQSKIISQGIRFRMTKPRDAKIIKINDIQINPVPQPHQAPVDLIIYIHDDTADFQVCLESVLEHTTQPYTITLVDDASDEATRSHLEMLAKIHQCTLLRNDSAMGYTQAMSRGVKQSSAGFIVLLNGKIIVTPGWLDGMIACALSDPKIGLVGVISNRVTNQSDPEISNAGATVSDLLPENFTPARMSELIAKYSSRLYPEMDMLDDCCLLIRRQVIDQVEDFGEDYCLGAKKAGWKLALADDTYIFEIKHDPENKDALPNLVDKTDDRGLKEPGSINDYTGISAVTTNRILEGIRANNRYILDRENLVQQGRELFTNRRVLFVLPVKSAGGGSNAVFLAVQAMRKMGVDAQIMNLHTYHRSFERSYPDANVPIFFADTQDIPDIAGHFDAIVATSNTSVPWIVPALKKRPELVTGYFIQDYEPYFYPPDSADYHQAAESYTLIPNLVRCVTTQWIYDQIQQHHGVACNIIGAHFDTDLFRPRPRTSRLNPDHVRIAAMIRPASERRSPKMTMDILQQVSKIYGARLEFSLFGCEPYDPGFAPLPKDFPWNLAGELRPTQIANLLNEADIFVDYSVFQALGITALESMSCGLATIVPMHGGTGTFAKHEENCLVVDTHDQSACLSALQRLIEDDSLRQKLQVNAISTPVKFYPELPTFNMLKALFPTGE